MECREQQVRSNVSWWAWRSKQRKLRHGIDVTTAIRRFDCVPRAIECLFFFVLHSFSGLFVIFISCQCISSLFAFIRLCAGISHPENPTRLSSSCNNHYILSHHCLLIAAHSSQALLLSLSTSAIVVLQSRSESLTTLHNAQQQMDKFSRNNKKNNESVAGGPRRYYRMWDTSSTVRISHSHTWLTLNALRPWW